MASNHSYLNYRQLNRDIRPQQLEILQALLPKGRVEGKVYVAANPWKKRCNPEAQICYSLRTGRWYDHVGPDGGHGIVSLRAYLRRESEYAAALSIINKLWGVEDDWLV